MFDATFVRPDLGAFCRLDELGLEVVGQRLKPDRAALACRVEAGEFDRWCRGCGGHGVVRDTVTRRLAHEPFGLRAVRWALQAIVCQHLAIARIAEALAVSWDTANRAVLDEADVC